MGRVHKRILWNVNRSEPIEIENDDGPEHLKIKVKHAIRVMKGDKVPCTGTG